MRCGAYRIEEQYYLKYVCVHALHVLTKVLLMYNEFIIQGPKNASKPDIYKRIPYACMYEGWKVNCTEYEQGVTNEVGGEREKFCDFGVT